MSASESGQPNTRVEGFLDKHHFLLRRLHSLTGILPIGVFLVNHLLTNASVAWGVINKRGAEGVDAATLAETGEGFARRVGTFQHEVDFINNLPFLIFIEITLWLSIAFHSVLGFYYAATGKSNTDRYGYQNNWRYRLQRISGYIGVFYIFYHVATLRWGWSFLVPGGTEWSHHYASSTMALALQGSAEGMTAAGFIVSLFYFLGASLLVFHFANGLWTAAITWGITISEGAQRRWGYACAGLGTGLMVLAWTSVIGFATLDPVAAKKVEQAILEKSPEARPADENDAVADAGSAGQIEEQD